MGSGFRDGGWFSHYQTWICCFWKPSSELFQTAANKVGDQTMKPFLLIPSLVCCKANSPEGFLSCPLWVAAVLSTRENQHQMAKSLWMFWPKTKCIWTKIWGFTYESIRNSAGTLRNDRYIMLTAVINEALLFQKPTGQCYSCNHYLQYNSQNKCSWPGRNDEFSARMSFISVMFGRVHWLPSSLTLSWKGEQQVCIDFSPAQNTF